MGFKNVSSIIIFLMVLGYAMFCYHVIFRNNFNENYFDSIKSQTGFQNLPKIADLHYSFFSQKEFYDKAFEGLKSSGSREENIKGLIVNHHLLAPDLIAEALSKVSSEKNITVVLISPNHFFAGRGQVISSLYDWQTPYGVLEADKQLIKKFQDKRLLNIEEWSFEKEHGISNLVAFIKKTLPNAKIVPLIVKDTFSIQAGNVFAENLDKILPLDSLVVSSLDFSHYLPSSAADFHDEKSLAVLSDFDYEGIKFLDIDSKPALRIFLKYLDRRNALNFNLLAHSNSAKILKDENMSEVTSYVTGYFISGNKKENEKITILSFGDLMLDGTVEKAMEENGDDYPFLNVARFLGGNDLTLVDLEGSFMDFQLKPIQSDKAVFAFDPSSVPALKRLGLNLFNLANNHSLDFGKTGLVQSKNHLDSSALDYFGDSLNDANISIIKEVRRTKVGFVGFNELSSMNFEKVIAEIKKIRNEADLIVVYAHWGGEYQKNFSANQQEKAHQLIDAGADVILGSHPHFIQPFEIYKNKLIFYSMGSFIFDQAFSLETQQGLGVGIVFGYSDIEYYLFPIEIINSQIYFADREKTSAILGEVADSSLVPLGIKNQILRGKIKMESKIYN
ncbi:MAG: AmmeMemoRadiSam system protein B [Minisyncoccia bacterium]